MITSQTAGSDLLADPDAPAPTAGTIQLSFAGGDWNFFGSTLFFDANFNGVLDFCRSQRRRQPTSGRTERAFRDHRPGWNALHWICPSPWISTADGVIDATDGRFVLVGGIDTATELALPFRLEAAVGHYNVSPLSTLAAKLVHELGFSTSEAETRTLDAIQVGGTSFSH